MKNKIVIAAALVALATKAGAYTLTPENVLHDMEQRPPKAVVADLNKSGRYERILDFIGKGKEEWIKVVPVFENAVDAYAAETLTISLAEGLPANPKAILSVVRSGVGSDTSVLNIADVCGAPFIEPSKKMLAAYFSRTIKAVSEVNAPELQDKKNVCLKLLQAAKAMPYTPN